ncbi:hypothetical protein NEAUS03_2242 [Nematocida ausubeli]|nr:hypothetical protein NEAUS03_2242 [Nematocida ausubeli]
MSSTRKIYLSLLIISGINAMFSPLCMPIASMNPCAPAGGSMLPDLSMGSGVDTGISLNCHLSSSGSSMGSMGSMGSIGSTLCMPPMAQQGGMIGGFDAGFNGMSSQPSSPPMSGIQLVCNSIGMPDTKQFGGMGSTMGGSSWGNDCYTKVGSIFMNGFSGGSSKLNDICCTMATGMGGNKLLR